VIASQAKQTASEREDEAEVRRKSNRRGWRRSDVRGDDWVSSYGCGEADREL
jgi:hypothetical protein